MPVLGLPLGSAGPAAAQPALPPGLIAARLAPGWVEADGTRMTALVLVLQPGWKTYWRAPGEAGIAPRFDWTGSQNQGAIAFHWPAPEVIDSGGVVSFGFHDRLVLPIEVRAADPARPVALAAAVDFGLCREVCVPAHLTLTAPPPGPARGGEVDAALSEQPRRAAQQPRCETVPIADGLRLTAQIPALSLPDGGPPRAAVEAGEGVWVSTPRIEAGAQGVSVTADLVPPSVAPFALDPATLRLTLIGAGDAVETLGCAG